jgi:hypothetical protein
MALACTLVYFLEHTVYYVQYRVSTDTYSEVTRILAFESQK